MGNWIEGIPTEPGVAWWDSGLWPDGSIGLIAHTVLTKNGDLYTRVVGGGGSGPLSHVWGPKIQEERRRLGCLSCAHMPIELPGDADWKSTNYPSLFSWIRKGEVLGLGIFSGHYHGPSGSVMWIRSPSIYTASHGSFYPTEQGWEFQLIEPPAPRIH